MTEYKRIREEALLTDEEIMAIEGRYPDEDMSGEQLFKLALSLTAQAQLDKTLKTKGIRIEADDQSLPSVRNAVNKSYNDYMLGQEDMLKLDSEGKHFVKVLPNKETEEREELADLRHNACDDTIG